MSDDSPEPEASPIRKWLKRGLGTAVPLGLGVLAFVALQKARSAPPQRPPEELGKSVRVVEVVEVRAIPRTRGYGIVRASQEWKLEAEVSGRVVEINENLEEGRVIRAEEQILKIDPRDFELSAKEKKAVVKNAKAKLADLRTKEKNTKASLKIAERSLELAEKELDRVRGLEDQGAISTSEVDQAEESKLNKEQTVQNYKNTLDEIPGDRRALQAQVDQYEAGAETAQLSVARTEILAPFDVRIREVNVEQSELVTVGAVLAEGDGIARSEVPAQFTFGSLRPLVLGAGTGEPPPTPEAAPAGGGALSTRALRRFPAAQFIKAKIRLESGDLTAEWDADFDRFGNVDSDTRTVSVVVAVDDPFKNRGTTPPLLAGMYVEVELEGAPFESCRAIPRSAVRGGRVNVVGADQRLEVREVETAMVQDEYVCIASGLEPGEQVVVTELVPAIAGTLLEVRVDDGVQQAVTQAATGETEQ